MGRATTTSAVCTPRRVPFLFSLQTLVLGLFLPAFEKGRLPTLPFYPVFFFFDFHCLFLPDADCGLYRQTLFNTKVAEDFRFAVP